MMQQRALMGATNSGGLVTSGLVAHFDAGNPASYPGSGATYFNLVSGATNGTWNIVPTFDPTFGGHFVNNGTQFCSTSWHASYPSGSQARTICMMHQVSSGGGNMSYIGSPGGATRWQLWMSGRYQCDSGGGTFQSSVTVPLNTWFYYCVTYPAGGLNTAIRMWQNGVDVSGTRGGSVFVMNTTQFLSPVGDSFSGATNQTPGRYALYHLYNRELTQAEILQNFNALRGRFGI